jgi:hypothetical protein
MSAAYSLRQFDLIPFFNENRRVWGVVYLVTRNLLP